MKILTLSGSAREESNNTKLLLHLKALNHKYELNSTDLPYDLPLFLSQLDANPLPANVILWRKQLAACDGLIICTPEYIHNMPAALKNALEWVTSSGELQGKKVLALTFTPSAPRGDKAMQSLLWSLKALDANILASLSLYHSDIVFSLNGSMEGEGVEILNEALKLFIL